MVKKVGILTAGGDCPGLNAVIRGIVKTAEYAGVETYGFLEGYKGLYNNNFMKLDSSITSDIIAKGGTILGSNNKTNIFAMPVKDKNGEVTFEDKSFEVVERLKNDNYDCLIIIGGDGSLKSARDFTRRGLNVIGVPKTIDNDVPYTDVTFGFNTAVTVATEANSNITITGNENLKNGENIITILVTNETGDKTATYQITVNKDIETKDNTIAEEQERIQQEKQTGRDWQIPEIHRQLRSNQ